MSIQNIPPPIDKTLISRQGTQITITEAKIAEDVQTSMGNMKKALTIECTVDGGKEINSYLFSIDKPTIAGSAGRILSRLAVKNISELTPAIVAKLKNQKFKVVNRNDKLYWY